MKTRTLVACNAACRCALGFPVNSPNGDIVSVLACEVVEGPPLAVPVTDVDIGAVDTPGMVTGGLILVVKEGLSDRG